MKISKQHRDRFKKLIDHSLSLFGEAYIESYKTYPGDRNKRLRWDLLWTSPKEERELLLKEVYEYANDDNIDTVLRSLVNEI